MEKKQALVSKHDPVMSRMRTYITGFILSVVLTLIAYWLVVNDKLSRTALIATIIALAMVQFLVQLIFFLHLGSESKPRWKFIVFSFMFGTVVILVVGSLWIMNNLNYHGMSPDEVDKHLIEEEGY